MLCCLTAPSHYLNLTHHQMFLWHSPEVISQGMLINLIRNVSSQIMHLKLLSHLPGAHELTTSFSGVIPGKPVAVTHSKGKGQGAKERAGAEFAYEQNYYKNKALQKRQGKKSKYSVSRIENILFKLTIRWSTASVSCCLPPGLLQSICATLWLSTRPRQST